MGDLRAGPVPPSMPRAERRLAGFTLTELLIALACAMLLAAFAYPAYTGQLVRTRREEGRQALYDLARRMEQRLHQQGSYAGARVGPGGLMPAATATGHYRLEVLDATAEGYRLAAVPQGAQAGDPCGTLTYSHLGEQGALGDPAAGRCWP